jgi:hypothetical protein
VWGRDVSLQPCIARRCRSQLWVATLKMLEGLLGDLPMSGPPLRGRRRGRCCPFGLNPCAAGRTARVTDFPSGPGGFFRGGCHSCALPPQACAKRACLRLLSWPRVSTLHHRGLRMVPMHRLPPSSLPLLRLSLSRRPQGLAGWARSERGSCQDATLLRTENRARGTPACVCACACGCAAGVWPPNWQAWR